MKFKFLSTMAGILMLSTPETGNAAEINNKLSANTSVSGELTISNKYLSNYVVRGRDPATKEVGSARLLKRNKRSLDFESVVDVEWDGLFPTVDISAPEFAEEITTIDLSKYDYPNSISWKNSELTFRGANLAGLVLNRPQSRDESIDQILLLFLNALSVAEVSTEAISGNEDLIPDNILGLLENLRPLAESIQEYQTFFESAEDFFALTEIIIEQADIFFAAANIQPDVSPEIQGAYDYLKGFSSALNSLGVNLTVNDEARAARTGTIASQYRMLDEAEDDKAVDAILTSVVNKFANEYSNASDPETRLELIEKYVVRPLSGVLDVYEAEQRRILKNLREDSSTSQTQISAQERKLNIAKNGFAIAQLAKFIFATDDFSQLARENPEVILSTLFDIAYIVGEELITIDNLEIVAKQTLQELTEADGRGVAFGNIRRASDNANAIMRAFQLGGTIGNKMIPLLWDVVLGENYLDTSIIDGTVTTLGETTAVIDVSTTGGFEKQFVNLVDGQQHFIAADASDVITVSVSMYRPSLFDSVRSPWELNGNVVPQTAYNFSVSDGGLTTSKRLCVRKILGNLDFAVHTTNLSSPVSGNCGEGTLRGLSAFEDIDGRQVVYRNPNDLPSEYLVDLLPENIDNYPLNSAYSVKGELGEKFFVAYSGLDLDSLVNTFQVIPREGNVDFSFSLDGSSSNNPFVSVELGEEFRNSDDPITIITWVWGDGSSPDTASLADGDDINSLLSVMHTYEEVGVYTVILGVTRQSGQMSERRVTINVFAPQLPAPSGLVADAGDRQIHLSWNEVAEAQSYNVYYASESFGEPPNIENYASFDGGTVIQNLMQTDLTIPFLEAGKEYFFVVTANDNSGEGLPSAQVVGVPLSFEDISLNLNNQTIERNENSLLISLQGDFGIRLVDFNSIDSSYKTVYSSSNLSESARLASAEGRYVLAVENDPSDDADGRVTKLLSSDDARIWTEIGSLPSRDRASFFTKKFEAVMVSGDNIATSVIERNGDVGIRTIFWHGDREKQFSSFDGGFGPVLLDDSLFVLNLDYRVFRRNDAYFVEYGLDGINETLVSTASNNSRLMLNFLRKFETSIEYFVSGSYARDGGATIERQTCPETPDLSRSATILRSLKDSDDNIFPVFLSNRHFLYRWLDQPTCRIQSLIEFDLPNDAIVLDGLVIGNQYHAVGMQTNTDGTKTPSLFSIDMSSGEVVRTVDLRTLL